MVDARSADEIRQLLAEDPDLPLLDTRPFSDFEEWHIPGATSFRHAPGEPLAVEELRSIIPSDADRIVTVCGMGISSFEFAEAVESHGFPPVTVLVDGMVGWSRVYDRTEIDLGGSIRCWQLQRLAKGCLGYVLACPATDSAVAVDAPIHIDEVTDLLEAEDLELEAVVDTHVHADHVSGGPRLADRHDVPYYIGDNASDRGLRHAHEPLGDEDRLTVGTLELTSRHTPGHTSDMVTIDVEDGTALLTADTLFVDSVGRTELESAEAATQRARELYESIMETLFSYPDETIVLPGHYDPEGDHLHPPDTPMSATLGEIHEGVDLLGADIDTFVETVTARTTAQPPNYEAIILVNLGGRPPPADAVVTQLELGPNRCAATS